MKKEWASVWISLVIIIILILIPTGFESKSQEAAGDRVAAQVLSVNNDLIIDTGLVRSGEQSCQVEILQGQYKGEVFDGINMLNGSLEQDKIFEAGDLALVLISHRDNEVIAVSMIDHYRLHLELILLVAFFVLLILFAGPMGLRAILSFVLTILTIWKVLVPLFLKGGNPILIGGLFTLFLTVMVIALVYGFSRRWLAAVSGVTIGLIIMALAGIWSVNNIKIHGAVMAFSESLLYSGYQYLSLTSIFTASIFIGAAGAVIDLAVDITSAVYEVAEKRPDLSWRELTKSGAQVGRAAMGTLTTTLLLAYSGGFISLLMVFMAQGTPLINILNYKYVAAELIHTLVGSFGLVAVAPLTSLTAGFFLARKQSENKEKIVP
jgi:uncharacterized membrane protein